jgi:DNA-binding response OmpR family regulator
MDGDIMTGITGKSPIILVIDDDFANRKVLEMVLKRSGYYPMLAEDGEDGLRQAREAIPDLILLDLFMPGEDGFEVLTRFKQDLVLKNVPVVIFTVLVREESEQKALELGAAAYVTKPFDVDEVVTCIRCILS